MLSPAGPSHAASDGDKLSGSELPVAALAEGVVREQLPSDATDSARRASRPWTAYSGRTSSFDVVALRAM